MSTLPYHEAWEGHIATALRSAGHAADPLSLDEAWWLAWRLGYGAELVTHLSALLCDEELARQLIDALPHVLGWRNKPIAIQFTGFEPFGPHHANPSAAVASAAADAAAGEGETLPVTYALARGYGEARLARAKQPTLLIHIGLASGRDAVSIEQFAHNTCGESPDNDGQLASPSRLLELSGPEARRTTLPIAAIAASLHQPEQPARVSRDTGTYVCNALYYASLGAAQRSFARGLPAAALFVHVPMMDDAAAAALGARLGAAMRALADALAAS